MHTLKENTSKAACAACKRLRIPMRNGKGFQILGIRVSGEIRNFYLTPCNEFTTPPPLQGAVFTSRNFEGTVVPK